ncbi:hypothetical protein B0A52_07655 [Exophiala mesophila]|uniref:Uncharacterized protein n=1 Tax=Exophiala mesophila TaxID=212818 RepID=A0A438MYH3_EXOME|nr:hypothetical protein B0A52_07655 [Exophiala mesophila]
MPGDAFEIQLTPSLLVFPAVPVASTLPWLTPLALGITIFDPSTAKEDPATLYNSLLPAPTKSWSFFQPFIAFKRPPLEFTSSYLTFNLDRFRIL